jgi:hypothetical protein
LLVCEKFITATAIAATASPDFNRAEVLKNKFILFRINY